MLFQYAKYLVGMPVCEVFAMAVSQASIVQLVGAQNARVARSLAREISFLFLC